MKKIIALFLTLILCFSFIACEKREGDSENDKNGNVVQLIFGDNSEQSTPLLFKVTDDSGNVLWLFGTIHVGRENYYPLPDYVMNALDNSDALAVEFDIVKFGTDFAAQQASLQALIYTDGTTLKDHVPEKIYNESVEILKKNGFYMEMLDLYKPAMFSSLIDSIVYEKLGIDTNLGVDSHLIKHAMDKNIEILDVESAEFQYNMLAGFSPELQVMMLEGSIESYNDLSDTKEDMEELMQAWYEGDEKKIIDLLNEEDPDITDEEKPYLDEYNEKMITSRNKSMTEYAENALKSGKEVFIAVGTAHIVGPGAVKENLESLGYKVELIK